MDISSRERRNTGELVALIAIAAMVGQTAHARPPPYLQDQARSEASSSPSARQRPEHRAEHRPTRSPDPVATGGEPRRPIGRGHFQAPARPPPPGTVPNGTTASPTPRPPAPGPQASGPPRPPSHTGPSSGHLDQPRDDGPRGYDRGPSRPKTPTRDRDRGRTHYNSNSFAFQHWTPHRYTGPRFYAPYGYQYRPWTHGETLPWGWYTAPRYLDWWSYRLPRPPIGCEWIRMGHDALLVDIWSGRVLSYGRFWFW